MRKKTTKLPGRGPIGCAKNGQVASAVPRQPNERAKGQKEDAHKRLAVLAAARSLKADDDGQSASADMGGHFLCASSSAPVGKARAGRMPGADNGQDRAAAASSLPIPILCESIQELRSRHKMWLRQRIRTTNTACALIARVIGDRGGKTEEAERKRLWSKATKLFSEFIAKKDMSAADASAIDPCLMDLVRFARSLDPIKEALRDVENGLERGGKELRARLNLTKPIGFGDLAFAVLVGEAGDFSAYKRDRLLFKRLGLIPFDGKAGKTWKTQPANAKRHLSADEWSKFGYDGRHLAAVYGYLLDPLFKHQWQSGKAEGTAGKPKGPYGKVYADRLAHTNVTHPEWTPGHRRQDALRLMAQAVLRNCWLEWRLAQGTAPEMADEQLPIATPSLSQLKRRAAREKPPQSATPVVPHVVSPKHAEETLPA